MKPILCCALLAISTAHGEPRHFPANNATTAPPKAIPVQARSTTTKIYVSASGTAPVGKSKPAQVTKSHKAATSNSWQLSPRVESKGKEDTVYGFMLKRPF